MRRRAREILATRRKLSDSHPRFPTAVRASSRCTPIRRLHSYIIANDYHTSVRAHALPVALPRRNFVAVALATNRGGEEKITTRLLAEIGETERKLIVRPGCRRASAAERTATLPLPRSLCHAAAGGNRTNLNVIVARPTRRFSSACAVCVIKDRDNAKRTTPRCRNKNTRLIGIAFGM